MSDPETREEIVGVVKEACTLRTVLKEGKVCPYFGASVSCRDCTYDWQTVALNVRKVAKIRRASYEQERVKVKDLEQKLKDQVDADKTMYAIVGGLANGAVALKRGIEFIGEIAAKKDVAENSGEEEKDVGPRES
jgi:hypothetical protein